MRRACRAALRLTVAARCPKACSRPPAFGAHGNAREASARHHADWRRGGCVLSARANEMAVVLTSSSRIWLAMGAPVLVDARQLPVRVVSIPSPTVSDRPDQSGRDAAFGAALPRFGAETGVMRWWGQYGCRGALGMDASVNRALRPLSSAFSAFSAQQRVGWANWCNPGADTPRPHRQ